MRGSTGQERAGHPFTSADGAPHLRLLLLLALVVALAAPSAAQGAGVTLRPAGATAVEATSGEVVTVPFRLTNGTPAVQVVRVGATVPPGWITISSADAPVELAPGEDRLWLLGFRLPNPAAPNRYRVSVSAFSPSGLPQASAAVNVVVPAVFDLDVEVERAPNRVRAGDAYSVRYRVANAGTVPATIELDATSPQAVPIELLRRTLALDPGVSEVVEVRVRTEPARTRSYRVDLRASPREAPDVSREAAAFTTAVRAGDRGRPGLPVEITVGGAQGGASSAGLIEVASSMRTPTRTLDLLVRVPRGRSGGLFPFQDQYRLRYESPRLGVRLGDHVYQLTPLTEPGRYGFGGQAEAHVGPITASAYYLTPRRGLAGHRQLAAQVGVQPDPRVGLTAQYLRADEWLTTEVATVRAVASPLAAHTVEAELGTSLRSDAGAHALSLTAYGHTPWLSYRARYYEADRDYSRRLPTTGTHQLIVVARPLSWLRLETGWQDREWVVSVAPGALPPTRRAETGRVGARVLARPAGARVDLYGGYLHRALTAPDAPGAREAGLDLRGGLALGRFSASTTAEIGAVHQSGLGPAAFARLQFQSRLSLPGQSYGAYLRISQGPLVASANALDQWSAGTSAAVSLSPSTRAYFDGRYSQYPSLAGSGRFSAQAHLEHTLRGGSRVSLRSRTRWWWRPAPRATWEVSAAYTVPLRVPLPSPARPELVGRVVDAETGLGVAGAEVLIGNAVARTGADGAFSVPLPERGTHPVRVDRLSIGLDRIPTQEAPTEITLTESEAPALVIPVTRRAALEGRVIAEAEGEGAEGLARVAVEATDGRRRLRTATDSGGAFSFIDLTPGEWVLRVAAESLPRHYALPQEAFPLALAPGEREEVFVEAVPRSRTARIIAGGRLQAAPPEPSPTTDPDGDSPSEPAGIDIARGGYTWIVGSYAASRAAADSVARAYRAEGFQADVLSARVDGRLLHRVAVGQFETRAQALAARETLPPEASRNVWLYRIR